jgi:DNA helicase-2/ATP-dependent DNA helicase PcrA
VGPARSTLNLHDWLVVLRDEIIQPHIAELGSILDDYQNLQDFIGRLDIDGDLDDMPLGEFAGIGIGSDRVNLSTIHSAKGREFDVVILFGMDEGVCLVAMPLPMKYGIASAFLCRLHRARHEVHLMFGQHSPSRFVTEIEQRVAAERA